MATESELIDLLDTIGDRAPAAQNTLDRLARQAVPAAPTQHRWLPITAAVAAVAASVVVSIAVRSIDARNATAASGPAAPTVDRATYRLPLDDYYASATQERTLQRAQFVLAQRCAKARGVTVPTAHIPAGNPRAAFLTSLAYNVRPLTLHQARTIGYDMYPSGPAAVDAATAGLTPHQLEIFQGWSPDLDLPKPTEKFLLDGGCDNQAAQTLLKGAAPAPLPADVSHLDGQPGLFDDDQTVDNVYLSQAASGEASREVGQAEKYWSTCMAAHSYAGLDTTQEAIMRAGHSGSLKSANAKRMAVQDVRCKQSTGFMTVWVASMTTAQRAVVAANRPQLAGFKKRLATRMANAARALR